MSYKNFLFFFILFFILLLSILFSLFKGHYLITISEFKNLLLYFFDNTNQTLHTQQIKQSLMVLYDIRLPRILAAVLIGASLAVSGVVLQGMFVNPLVSPSILGVLAGSSFGAALGMLFHQSYFITQISAFIFGFIAVLFALFISKFYAFKNSILMLVLGGIISSSLFSALLSLIKYIADPYDSLPSIVYWLMGSLAYTEMSNILSLAPFMLISILILIIYSKHLNILSLGEDEANTLGVDVKKTRFLIIFFATLLSALSVSLAGVIGWIGLVIPHLSRFLVGSNHTILIPFSAIFGSVFLLLIDTISRTSFEVEIPLGILTSLIGIPIFILVLRYRFKG